jgi:hypothetical protein
MAKIFEKGLYHYTNANVGKNYSNDSSYIIGYWEAGDILVDTAINQNNPQKDRLFFPICYNYRHFIELFLKYLILKAEELYSLLETNDMQNKKHEALLSYSVNNTHNIHILLNMLINVLECISDDKFSRDIKISILEYHNMDKNGQKFRYSRSKNDKVHFEIQEVFDLEKIKKAVTKIGYYLMGIDMYLYEHGKFIKSYIAEMESIYGRELDYQANYYW